MAADLTQYLDSLNPLDRRTHCQLANLGILPPVPEELAQAALTAEIREEDLTEEQWAVTNANDPDWEALGLTLEALKLADETESALLTLPGFWGYVRRCPEQFHAPHTLRLLARITGRYLGLKVSPRDGAFLSRARAETVTKNLRDRHAAGGPNQKASAA